MTTEELTDVQYLECICRAHERLDELWHRTPPIQRPPFREFVYKNRLRVLAIVMREFCIQIDDQNRIQLPTRRGRPRKARAYHRRAVA